MALDHDGDLAVDILIIGGGIQAFYLARALKKQFSVCVLVDPDAPSETLDSPGFFTAGYDGNDVPRIQPARRSAGFWKLWAESNGVPHDYSPAYFVMPSDQEVMRTRLWSDANLVAKATTALPQVFGRGSLDDQSAFLTENDVVMNPTQLMAKLREGLEDRIVWGEVIKFVLATDKAIDFVEVDPGDGKLVPITARYFVFAANAGNGTLLQKLVARFKDHAKRKEAAEKIRTCQAVRRRHTVVIRGDALPLVCGSYDGLSITAHPYGDRQGRVWIVSPPIDDSQTLLGPEEVRFEPKVDSAVIADTLDRLFEVSPQIKKIAGDLRWGAYVGRKTEHPAMAVSDTSNVAQPSSAKLETLDIEGFVAMWPSHLGYAMIVSDVIAERIEQALGSPGDFSDSLLPVDLSKPPSEIMTARWERQGFSWNTWVAFAEAHGFKK